MLKFVKSSIMIMLLFFLFTVSYIVIKYEKKKNKLWICKIKLYLLIFVDKNKLSENETAVLLKDDTRVHLQIVCIFL